MKAASQSELKQELQTRTQKELLELCLRLARFKKENKELLTFLLFEADNLQSYIESVKIEIDQQFSLMNKTNIYFAKKSARKILKLVNRFTKYAASKEAEVQLLIYYCTALKLSGVAIHKSSALNNLFNTQIKKINTAIESLHEDLQYEYKKDVENVV